MSAVFVLVPLALLIAGIAVALFVWAVRSGQFDDLDTPPVRILFDDEAPAAGRRADAGPPGAEPGTRSQSR
jgi:cbb3-type cytochrome oxidase maturation protein